MSHKGFFGLFKRKSPFKRLDQMFNNVMSDVRIYAQRQDYKGAVIASFHGFTDIASQLLNLTRPVYETGREFGMKVAEQANISKEVMDEYLTSFELARYTNREITYDEYEEAMQRLDICFRGMREQGIVAIEQEKGKVKAKGKAKGKVKVKAAEARKKRRRPVRRPPR